MKTLLLTGFGLWGSERYNSSWEILRDNPLALSAEWQARTHQLPVSWTQVPAALDALLAGDDIEAVVCFGMCGGRTVNVERIAINLNDTNLHDAEGTRARGEFVIPAGPPAYWSRLPAAAIVHALEAAHIPAAQSRHAGGFLCNFTFYQLMHRLAIRQHLIPGGFIHVPHYETEGGLPAEVLRLAVPIIAREVVKECHQ